MVTSKVRYPQKCDTFERARPLKVLALKIKRKKDRNVDNQTFAQAFLRRDAWCKQASGRESVHESNANESVAGSHSKWFAALLFLCKEASAANSRISRCSRPKPIPDLVPRYLHSKFRIPKVLQLRRKRCRLRHTCHLPAQIRLPLNH